MSFNTDSLSRLLTDRKRHVEDLPVDRLRKRSNSRNPPETYVNSYDQICFELEHLRSSDHTIGALTDIDDVSESLESLDLQLSPDLWDKSLPEMLDMEWHTFVSLTLIHKRSYSRAIELLRQCGIFTFRDILWYNNSLLQPASLQRFPICLVDMAFNLHEWGPRKCAPSVSLSTWSSAWHALKVIWKEVVDAMPSQLRQALLYRKYAVPPESCNWFEFNYFDGITDHKEPVLCYYDDDLEKIHTSAGGIKSPPEEVALDGQEESVKDFQLELEQLEHEITELFLGPEVLE